MTGDQERQAGPDLPDLNHRRITDLLLQASSTRPEAIFVEFPSYGVQWTYGEFLAKAQQVAAGFRRVGLVPGDRLGIMLPNRPEYLLAWFGSLLAGTIDVSINHAMAGQLLIHQLSVAGVKAAVCDAHSSQALLAVEGAAPSLKMLFPVERILSGSKGRLFVEDFADLVGHELDQSAPASAKDIVSIRYTSGTTGPAKAVATTHSRLYVVAAHFVWLTAYTAADCLYSCFPLHHGIASALGVITTLMAGGKLILDERFSASRYWDSVRAHGATLAHIINPLVPILLAQPATASDGDHLCRRMWTAESNSAFESRFQTRLIYFYGQSEGSVIAHYQPSEASRAGSCGRTSRLFDVQICDADDYPVAPGTVGQILWRPLEPHLMTSGYFGDPESTVSAWQNLWFHSGDLGKMDNDGYLYLIGRTGDQIRRKGVNIPAQDIEAVTREYPGIAEAAAVAVPSELGESEVKLVVAWVDEPSVAGLLTFLRSRLPPEMVPRFIDSKTELPHTDTFKVSKEKLRREGITASTFDTELGRRG